jgi:hypothetical protein
MPSTGRRHKMLLPGDLSKCHSEIRLAVEEASSDEGFACPVCSSPCQYTLLGEGGTHRSLMLSGCSR